MNGQGPTRGQVISVWWLLVWRSVVGCILFVLAVGIVFSAIGGVIGMLMNLSPDLLEKVGHAAGYASVPIGAILSSILVVRMAPKKLLNVLSSIQDADDEGMSSLRPSGRAGFANIAKLPELIDHPKALRIDARRRPDLSTAVEGEAINCEYD